VILPLPERHREEDTDELRWALVALARPPSHCNMNINVRSAAGSQSQHRGTGEPPRSTS
jgi:hypothetical protein